MAIHLLVAASSGLIDQTGGRVSTDEFGIDTVDLRFTYENAAAALSARPARGSVYAGSSPEYSGFVVEKAGAVREVGGVATIDVQYMAVNATTGSQKLNQPDISADTDQRSQVLTSTLTIAPVPVPQPVAAYRFGTTTPPSGFGLGHFGTPPGIISAPTSYTFDAPYGGITYTLVYAPNPRGWLCVGYDVQRLCDDRIFAVSATYKLFFYFQGYSAAPTT